MQQRVSDELVVVNLITIYDGADIENISDKELKKLIENIRIK